MDKNVFFYHLKEAAVLGEEDEVDDGKDVVVGDVGVGRGECEVLCPVSV